MTSIFLDGVLLAISPHGNMHFKKWEVGKADETFSWLFPFLI